MLKDIWMTQGFGPFVHIVQRDENIKSVKERKNITSNRVFPPLDNMDKTHKTPLPCGYAPAWTPVGCRAFLAELQPEIKELQERTEPAATSAKELRG